MSTNDIAIGFVQALELVEHRAKAVFAEDRNDISDRRAVRTFVETMVTPLKREGQRAIDPIKMVLHCPNCGTQHIDKPEPERQWLNPPHRSHLCAKCAWVWRPADVATVGVEKIQTKGERDSSS